MGIKQLLFRLARSGVGRLATGWMLAHMSFAIPVQRLRETDSLLAFHHPQPGYPVHILIVPKRPYGSLMDVPPGAADFMADLFSTVQSLVRELGLEERGYRLIANGGAYQDIPHLHFHLVSGAPLDQPLPYRAFRAS